VVVCKETGHPGSKMQVASHGEAGVPAKSVGSSDISPTPLVLNGAHAVIAADVLMLEMMFLPYDFL